MLRTLLAVGVVVCLLAPLTVEARITRIEITNTSDPDPDGYITITGTAYGEVDPTHPLNTIIQDIELAPRNGRGMVEYSMDITILKPPDGGNGLLLYEVINRGLPMTRFFFPGVGQLMRQRGYTIVWSGWQGDLLPLPHPLQHQMTVPVATENGTEISGRVRIEYEVTNPGVTTLNISGTPDVFITYHSYEPLDPSGSDASLSVRVMEADPRVEVPKTDWVFADCSETPFPGVPSTTKICLKDGFEPLRIYELLYTAKNPLVLGLGFAGPRDLVSFLRYSSADDEGTVNPVDGITAAMMHGPSQSGRYLRTYLQLGFNQDEDNRIVFEGMNPHIGPARVALNIRFGQPYRNTSRRAGHTIPGWETPFTWMPAYDPVAKRAGWLFERCLKSNTCPKIVETISSAEYWNSRASLSTTDPTGKHDRPAPRTVRTYLLSGTQHTPAGEPENGICQQLNNPNNYRPYLRAAVVALEEWVTEDTLPPPSRVPSIVDGTLVSSELGVFNWPDIPGVNYTGIKNELPLIDYGPQYDAEDTTGALAAPPAVDENHKYGVLVPQVDVDGNEIAGVRSTEIQAPIGTYTGWNLVTEQLGMNELCGQGSLIPFATTRSERDAVGDPRPSLEERYGDHEGYVDAVRAAANRLVAQRFLLSEDAAAIVKEAEDSDVLVPPETENQAPVAVITPESQTVASLEVVLDGSKSHDPDGDPITYSWKATGAAALVMGDDTATARVQFHSGTGDYTFELTVTDDKGATGTSTTTVAYFGP